MTADDVFGVRTRKRVKAKAGVASEAVQRKGKVEWWWRDPKARAVGGLGELPPLW